MRDFTRATLSFLMFVFLLAGCVHNIYHFQELTENSTYNHYNRYRGSNYYNSRSSSTYDNDYEEAEIVYDTELDEVVITPDTIKTEEYQEEERSRGYYY